ncbi:MAG: 5-dehydro-2-deoxygluconokinase [Egibacteraceae bacterium]
MTKTPGATWDLVTVGRVNMDLIAREIGAEFADVSSFDATVGGSPTNIAIATARLGLRTIAFTAVGEDRVGDFVLRYLRDEGVETSYIPRKSGKLTSLALLGVQPPDEFPLSFYREDPADIHLTVTDAQQLPCAGIAAQMLSGNAFSRGSCADAALACAEHAERLGRTVYLDLDLRPTDWSDPGAFGLRMRSVLPLVDVAIGTEEEFHAALAEDPDIVTGGEPLPDASLEALDERVSSLVSAGTVATVVLKRGPEGVTVFDEGERYDVPGFGVEVVNTVGAGDAFASGLVRTRTRGGDWPDAARFANACGAIQVTRHGCAVAFPTEHDVRTFLEEQEQR